MANAVIIGGGAAGAAAARSLRKKLGVKDEVILIEKEEILVNRASLPFYALGRRKWSRLSRSRSMLKKDGVHVIAGEALKIDGAGKKIRTAREEIGYDLLLIAAGAEHGRNSPPGMAESGLDLQSPGGAEKLRAALDPFEGGEIAIAVAPGEIRCPAGPYEYALLIDDWFRRRQRSRDVTITIYIPEKAPLLLFGSRTSEAAAGLLLKRNIRLHAGARISGIDGRKREILLGDESFPYDLLLCYGAAEPPLFIGKSGLAGEGGWIPVHRHTMKFPDDDDIFAVGDVTEVRSPAGMMLPKLGAVAHLQALAAAANMAARMKGTKAGGAYSGFAG